MEPFIVDERIEETVSDVFPCPLISAEYLRKIANEIVERHERNFGIANYCEEILDSIKSASFSRTAVFGTGLPNRINHPKYYDLIQGPIVLELVHLTDVGVSGLALERARQDYGRRLFLDKIAQAGSTEGQALGDFGWQAMLENYPRRRLKLTFSDGYTELEALELERLPFHLGVTPMGTKVRLTNLPIVGGVAYLLRENVEDIGGAVDSLQKQHHRRLHEELQRRMDDDDREAESEGLLPEQLYLSNI
ncbi:hypothetical protein NMY22_g1618 [Coprinellus aureogranulatus]|nr:hypothetical protein NMY22_g1618 [Coprinellus aureogranulatus]